MVTTSPTLLDRLRRPTDAAAWQRFVSLYTPLVLCLARRNGFQEADAADLAQEVFVKLLRELPRYERGAGQTFRGWLNRVVVNQGRDFRRRLATRALAGETGLSGVAADAHPVAMDEAEYRGILVRRALDQIKADFNAQTWTAFTAVMVDGRDAKAVATGLGISVNAVHLARHRVMTRLRQEVEGLAD